mgnify:CR=1 FL=1
MDAGKGLRNHGPHARTFAAVVEGLKKAKKPLVVVGSEMDQGGGTAPVRIGMAINMLLDRVNKEGGMRVSRWPRRGERFRIL